MSDQWPSDKRRSKDKRSSFETKEIVNEVEAGIDRGLPTLKVKRRTTTFEKGRRIARIRRA